MINKKEISAIAKRILHTSKGLKNPRLMHPVREWWIGVVVALLIFLVSASWSVQTYVNNQNTNVEESGSENTEVVVYRESQVAASLEHFAERGKVFDDLLNSVDQNEVIESVESSEDTSNLIEAEVSDNGDTSTTSENQEEVAPATEEEPEVIETVPDEVLAPDDSVVPSESNL